MALGLGAVAFGLRAQSGAILWGVLRGFLGAVVNVRGSLWIMVTGGGDESDAVWGMDEGYIAYGLISVLRVFLPVTP